jgi:hypothetical protein
VVVDDYSRTVYTKPLHPRLEAAGTLKVFKVAAKSMVQMKLREVMTDDGEKDRCDGPVSNRLALCTIGVLTNTVRAKLYSSGFFQFFRAKAFSTTMYSTSTTAALNMRSHALRCRPTLMKFFWWLGMSMKTTSCFLCRWLAAAHAEASPQFGHCSMPLLSRGPARHCTECVSALELATIANTGA